ncbi:MAG: DUF3987 domain-containing protein [Rikenellaceae bacterium]
MSSLDRYAFTEDDFVAAERYNSLFPIQHLPHRLQYIIGECCDKLGFPADYISSSILLAVASAIGNSVRVKVKEGWWEKPIIYMALVGNAGANKSHPMSWAMQPLVEADVVSMEQFKREMEEFLPGGGVKPRPVRKVVSDTTVEGLVALHANNPRGLTLFADELKGWIANFTRYSSGSQEQFWLSNFSGKPVIVDRKNSESSILISEPFINVLGSTQPKVLNSFAKGDRSYNGFTDRILWSIIDSSHKSKWSRDSISPDVELDYKRLINAILELSDEVKTISLSESAYDALMDWQGYNADLINSEEQENLVGMQSKLEIYMIRVALIVHILRFYCSEVDDISVIDSSSVAVAAKIIEYYRLQGVIASKYLYPTLLNSVPEVDRKLFENLPCSFCGEDLAEAAKSVGISRSTAYRLISKYDGVLCSKVGHNRYIQLEI